MSVERAHGYHSGDRIIHVDPEDGEVVEPLGGYVPMQRLVGAAATVSAAERWLTDHPVSSLTGEGDPQPTRNSVQEELDDLATPNTAKDEYSTETTVISDDDIEELTKKALTLA